MEEEEKGYLVYLKVNDKYIYYTANTDFYNLVHDECYATKFVLKYGQLYFYKVPQPRLNQSSSSSSSSSTKLPQLWYFASVGRIRNCSAYYLAEGDPIEIEFILTGKPLLK
jgi:hypothetical protein